MFYVYLVCSELENKKLYKIGYTRRTVEKRIKEFKTGNSSEIYIIDSFRCKWGTKIEANLKRRYKNHNINGEWFDLPQSEVDSFIEVCQKIENNLNLISKENTYFLDKGDF